MQKSMKDSIVKIIINGIKIKRNFQSFHGQIPYNIQPFCRNKVKNMQTTILQALFQIFCPRIWAH